MMDYYHHPADVSKVIILLLRIVFQKSIEIRKYIKLALTKKPHGLPSLERRGARRAGWLMPSTNMLAFGVSPHPWREVVDAPTKRILSLLR